MVDNIKTAIREMCKAHKYGRLGMADDMGMSLDQFHNHLYQKCGSRFFTVQELERMEDLSGTSYLAEYFAARSGKLLVDMPVPGGVDKVELYDIEMQVAATAGDLATAKLKAAADGVIDNSERKALSDLFSKKLRHQIHGFMGFLALYGAGVSDQAVDFFVATNRKGDAPSVQLGTSGAPIL
ncbi:YmfL family putative regulatory protein [Siccibacter colletis]|uniref:YmfL family putative regulatory protein n=1 Tax=Siccibacter colletis TaxID=1505757 RepID=UPI0028BDDDA3|nr:YmfL family putative regulatory protein [Siccibacter colletis]WNN49852.1 YmfL family putative regulatory protein [Siccibacter colletis]